ncbi:MAG: branched-chain amino acid aminotransferase [Spirochaetales bacterium]|jgi:branched-chain amino acid aminotransferase|nr:branched-chain amino acid aminotransferase [Spirochaetales bacterium]
MDLEFIKRETLKDKPKDETKLGFGRIFTDYMLMMKRDNTRGWFYAAIEPFGDLSLSPAALVLHYAQEVFEGLKAYRGGGGRILLFRPWENMKRMALSAARLSMQPFDSDFLLNSIYELVKREKDWIPAAPGTSLYIRPTYIGIDPFVGVAAAEEYLLYVILSPVGAYYPRGLEPVDIFVENNYVRTVRGGTGTTKAGANYAISLLAGEEAHQKGFSQVLWLDGVEKTYIEEVGSMNIFFKIDGEIITPALQGSILPGVTRDSIIRIARDKGMPVSEKRISIYEIEEAQADGKLEEVFGSGTAAVVSPVGKLVWGDKTIVVGDGGMGQVTRMLYDTITGIQYGRIEDPYGWTYELK